MNYKATNDYHKTKQPNKRTGNHPKNANKTRGKKGYRKQRGTRYDNTKGDEYVYKKPTGNRKVPYIYKQDLIQKGLQVAEDPRLKQNILALADDFPECINSRKRKVIVGGMDGEESHINKSRLTNREDLKEELEDLIGNEDIPDWYMEEGEKEQTTGFDFGLMAQRTLNLKNEISTHFKDLEPIKKEEGFGREELVMEKEIGGNGESIDKMDYEDIDKYLEMKIKRDLQLDTSFDEEGLYKSESEEIKQSINSKQETNSKDGSKDYFNNLQQNIKDILFQDKSEEEEASNDSFEDLGFDHFRRGSLDQSKQSIKESQQNETVSEANTTKNDQSEIHPTSIPDNTKTEAVLPDPQKIHEEEAKKAIGAPIISTVLQGFDLKSHIEERKKITKEERELKKNIFISKYGYMDDILCQVVTEMMRSKRKNIVNKHSCTGFNVDSILKYKAFKYKIFSLFLQGNVISKVWLYKNKKGEIKGPYMSFDMDIWNSDGLFTEDHMIAIGPSPFLPAQMFIDRDPICLELIEEFRLKALEISEKMAQPVRKKKFNQKKPHKGYEVEEEYVEKKPEKRVEKKHEKRVEKVPEINYDEDFPALGSEPVKKKESQKTLKQKKKDSKKKKEEPKKEKKSRQEINVDDVHKQANKKKVLGKKEETSDNADMTKKDRQAEPKQQAHTQKLAPHKRTTPDEHSSQWKKKAHHESVENDSVYVEKKVEKVSGSGHEGNKELTDNLKNLLGL